MSLMLLSTLIASETGVQVDGDAVWADIERAADRVQGYGSFWVTGRAAEHTQWVYRISKQPAPGPRGEDPQGTDLRVLELAITPLNTASPFFSDAHPVGAPIHIQP